MTWSMSLVDDDPFANLASPTTSTRPADGHGQARPAHTRPAFIPRPSLPALHTLAQMNMTVPERKVRKGTPGARLPHEPWNLDLNADPSLLARNTPFNPVASQPETEQSPVSQPPPQSAIQTEVVAETCFEFAVNSTSLVDETCSSSRSSSGDDADTDSLPLPPLSYTASEPPPSSVLSRSSSAHIHPPMDVISPHDDHHDPSTSLRADNDHDITEEDPLSYHSDFDYYTQSLSDLSDSEPDPDLTTGENPTLHPSPPITPHSSLYDPVVNLHPDSSLDTMRRASSLRQPTQPNSLFAPSRYPNSPPRPGRQCGREDQARDQKEIRRNGDYSGSKVSGANAGGVGGGDKSRRRRDNRRSSFSSTSSCTSSSEDNTDGITVYYSFDGMSNDPSSRTHSRTCSRYSKAGGGSDDDIPLAQRVPTALSAQKSIRKQLHDERQQRKLERAKSSRAAAESRPPSRPTESAHVPVLPTTFRKRSMSTAGSRTTPEAFPVEDLTRKLINLQTCARPPPPGAPLAYDGSMHAKVSTYNGGISRSSSRGRHTDRTVYSSQKSPRVPETPPQDRPLRPMRSFHGSNGWHSEAPRRSTEQTSAARPGHSTTASASTRITRARRDTTLAGHEQSASSGRVSEDGRKPSASIPRPSTDREGDATQRVVQRLPVPPLPILDSASPQSAARVPVVQQRIFIGDMQRFNIVEIGPATNAGDVIDTVASQGMLDRSGSWMLFEVAQDYGMERPIREYELLADVSASWNKDKLLNAFVIKQTPLAQLLSRSALPTSSPTHRGWIEWESKRGKWSKRWMELREHGIWLSKRDTGKDEIFLCSLSNFDAYFVTRRHKSPKGFTFSIKSTDHPSLFENAADYLHVFSCSPKDGEKWMQVILVARSYVLYQERHVLFAKPAELLSQAKPLTRTRTRKQSVSSRPPQPLVSVPPPFSQSPTANVTFEPGSLLAKRKGDATI